MESELESESIYAGAGVGVGVVKFVDSAALVVTAYNLASAFQRGLCDVSLYYAAGYRMAALWDCHELGAFVSMFVR